MGCCSCLKSSPRPSIISFTMIQVGAVIVLIAVCGVFPLVIYLWLHGIAEQVRGGFSPLHAATPLTNTQATPLTNTPKLPYNSPHLSCKPFPTVSLTPILPGMGATVCDWRLAWTTHLSGGTCHVHSTCISRAFRISPTFPAPVPSPPLPLFRLTPL